nr:ABC transporter permease [Propionicimonas sp.]
MLPALAGVLIVFWLLGAPQLGRTNVMNVLVQNSTVALIAVGLTFVILTAGLDLSLGANVAATAVVSAAVMKATGSLTLGLVTGVLVGLALGLLLGGFIAAFDLIPFVATLGGIYLINGITLVFTRGETIGPVPTEIVRAMQRELLGIPVPVVIVVAVYVVGQYLLTTSVWGRQVVLIGANPRTAMISGIPVARIAWSVYVVAGACAGLAGVLFACRLGGAVASTGMDMFFTAVGAVVIGGTSLMGGRGSLIRTAIGVLFLGFLTNGLQILGTASYDQRIATGLVIIIAVALDTLVFSRNADRT